MWVRKFPWRRDKLPTPVFLGFSGGSDSKESACSVGNLGLIPGLERSPGEGNGYPLQYSGLENFMDRGVWQAVVHGVKESDTTKRLSLPSLLHCFEAHLLVTYLVSSLSFLYLF